MRYLFTLSLSALLLACGNGEPVALALHFSPKVGGDAFSCSGTYTGIGATGATVRPVDFRLYVHDLRLVSDGGEEVPFMLDENGFQTGGVGLLDFEDASGECAQGDAPTNDHLTGTIEPGFYRGLKFRLGVPFELNHAELGSSAPPLDRTSLYWGWRLGHVFLAAVSRSLPAGDVPENEHFTHVGSTGCEGDPAQGIAVTGCAAENRPEYLLTDFDPEHDAIEVDFAEIKAGTDVTQGMGCHSFGESCTPAFERLGIRFADGSYVPEQQTVFRVGEHPDGGDGHDHDH